MPRVKRVLILHSFGRNFAPFSGASAAFRRELAEQSRVPIEFLEASLETARFVEGGADRPVIEYLRALFTRRPPDLLVPFGAPAMNFLLQYRKNLFPGVPVLIAAVDKRPLGLITRGANATAVGVDLDLPGIIEHIIRLLPTITSIDVIIGASPLEKFWLAQLREEFQPFTNRLRFNWLNELSFEEMRRRFATLPGESAVFYALLLVDAAGVPQEQDHALEVLRSETRAPIFGAFDSQLGRGIIGGPLYPDQQLGRDAARVAVRILNGESPGAIQPVLLGSATPVYDWRELKRWQISERRLPPGSIIRFKEPSLWARYRWYVIAALAIIAVQAALLGGLLFERARHRRTGIILRESEENLRRLIENSAAVPWQANAETWAFTFVGAQAVKLLGYPVEQWHQENFWVTHLHPDDKEFAINTCLTNSEKKDHFEFEYRMIAESGQSVWVHDLVRVERRHGKPVQLRGFMLDISERKQVEERFRLAVEALPTAIVMVNGQGQIVLVNVLAERLFGYHRDELIGQSIDVLVPERFRGEHQGFRADFCAAPRPRTMGAGRDLYARRKDGSEVLVEVGLSPIQTQQGSLVLTSIVDISMRKQAEEALRKERAFLRQVIDIDPNFIFAKDREGRFTLANRAVADAYGTTVENLIGKTDADFNPHVEEVRFFHQMDLQVMNTLQERFIPEEHITDARGKVRWLQTVKRPIIGDDGSANQVLGASTDITRRKETDAELQRNRDALAHMTRVSAMGELAASLAHELNQPLTAILSNAQAGQRFLAVNPADLDELGEILKDIVEDNNRASQVIQRMRALVKKEEPKFEPTNLLSVINEIVQFLHGDAVLHNIRVTMECAPGLPPVRGDKVQLQQVMLNLMLNAFDAVKDGPLNDHEVLARAERQDGNLVKVAVRDRGSGVTPDMLDKIFQPFYTTKREGLGMGLSISRTIIEAHGGRLWAENNHGRGATFYFTVPVEITEGEKDIVE